MIATESQVLLSALRAYGEALATELAAGFRGNNVHAHEQMALLRQVHDLMGKVRDNV